MYRKILSQACSSALITFSIILITLIAACGIGDSIHPSGRDVSVRPGDELSPDDLEAVLRERLAQRLSQRPTTEIKGQVIMSDDTPIPGVHVQAGKLAAETDSQGNFVLTNVEYGTYVVSFEHPNYVFTQRTIVAQYDSSPYLVLSMLERSLPKTINADQLTEFVQGPLKLVFKPGDLVIESSGLPVHGNIEVLATTIEPGKKGDIEASPAPLEGLSEGGQVTSLVSLGMFEIEILQNGERVQVRPGGSVDVRMQLPELAGINETSVVPLWHHDHNLGIWVQASGLQAHANGHSKNGALEFAAALPHFSTWNFDTVNKSICVYSYYENVSGFRTVSTLAGSATPDNLWSITGECRGEGCVTNAPSGFNNRTVYFKFQALIPTNQGNRWCDAPMMINQSQTPQIVITGTELQAYAQRINGTTSTDSYCGSLPPAINNPGELFPTGPYDSWRSQTITASMMMMGFGLALAPADSNGNGQINDDMICPNGAIPTIRPADTGFTRMMVNSRLSTAFSDVDRDGLNDAVDRCPLRSNNNACTPGCYVSPSDPNAAMFDFDLDTIDDFCDTKFAIFNPTQNNGL